jgi:hypothetical protein
MSLYIFLFLAVRWPARFRPPTPAPAVPDAGSKNTGDGLPEDVRTRWDRLKAFTYRAGRCLSLVNTLLIFGCWCEIVRTLVAVQRKMKLGATEGVGGGSFCEYQLLLVK